MITLHVFGPFLGTPDSSPFVIKVMALLRLAGLPHRCVQGNPFKAPHGFLPWIDDEGLVVADSTLIRRHLEAKYGIDFDATLTRPERASAWAVERMCEDHLYFAMLASRWLDDDNFREGLGRHMFGSVPAPARPLVKAVLRRANAARLSGHGLGRHAPSQIASLAIADIDALADILADRPFLMGLNPCGADASVYGLVTAILTPPIESPLRTAMAARTNLLAYRDRMTDRLFPEFGMAPSPAAPVRQVVSAAG